ncbi:DEP1A protein, partial [Pitta sordida]|nr:DEP1A protein [Pitta sordida]
WNELTRHFRAGMPVRRHRQRLRTHGSCFTAAEAADWLHRALRSDGNFGPEVTRQQTVQLLRKFLKNHVIEDIKGRWGAETLEDNGALYRFPATSPVKPLPSPPRENLENLPADTEKPFKLSHLSKRTLKKHEFLQSLENLGKPKRDLREENKEDKAQRGEISQEYIHETWRNVILIHLQTILGLPSLEEVVQPEQLDPQHVLYNLSHSSRHGVVTLQDKSEDLPHWVLSAMKCLAYWPRHNTSQATYDGFERDVFTTVADYFLSLPEPLLTFEFYELFVNILVLCGCITIPKLCSGARSVQEEKSHPQPPKTLHLNSFKSTECLLLSLLLQEADEKEKDGASRRFPVEELSVPPRGAKEWQQNQLSHPGGARALMGGSCQNLSGFRKEQDAPGAFRTRCYSLERLGAAGCGSLGGAVPPRSRNAGLEPGSGNSCRTQPRGSRRGSTSALQGLLPAGTRASLTSLGRRNSRSCSAIDAEIAVKPRAALWGQGEPHPPGLAAPGDISTEGCATSCRKRLCQSSSELSGSSLTPSPCVFPGRQKLLQPPQARVAVEALQICCLCLPPPRRRRLQLLLRMMARISGNAAMPPLSHHMATRTLMLQTFSRCVLRSAEQVELDELLSSRLLAFLLDHQQQIFQLPTHLQAAVREHLQDVRRAQCKCPKEEICAILPTYSYCKQITPEEFEEQKVSTSQAAVAELLENIIKDKNLSVKDKKKKLKQFQREYPHIYRSRFPTTASEGLLLDNKPTLKQPLLSLRRGRMRSLR